MNINRVSFLLLFLLVNRYGYSQQLVQKIGTNPTVIESSAALEIQSDTKGFLPPRMTYQKMTAIVSPATGLMVYCTDCSPAGLRVYDGFFWIGVSSDVSLNFNSDCSLNGFTGTFNSGITLSGSSFSVTITNNSYSTLGPISFLSSDIQLSGITGLSVGTPTPSSVTLSPGSSQIITYPISGTPASSGILRGYWKIATLNCSTIQLVN